MKTVYPPQTKFAGGITTAIIIAETMFVGLTLRFFNKYSLMLVSETSRNALFLKTITKIHCSIVGFYQYFSKIIESPTLP